jgi:hypothetical protein
MTPSPFAQLLEARYHFLKPSLQELQRLFPEGRRMLPSPYPIFLEDEAATPLYGFPVLIHPQLDSLREALAQYIEAEEMAQMSAIRRLPFPRSEHKAAWERYRSLLVRAVENATVASYGRHFPAVFWLQHSLDVARRLRETPKRVLRHDLEIGRAHGDRIKYRAYEKYVDRVRTAVLEVVHRLAPDVEEAEEELFPRLLHRMFDNVLIFTEEQVSSDLAELSAYFNGYLQVDGKEVRRRLERLVAWHARQIADDWELRSIATNLVGADPDGDSSELINRPGYVSFLAARSSYNASELLSPPMVQLWETLVTRLKEFEVLNALRALVLAIRREGERLVFRASGLDRTWVGQRLIYLSPSTRPLDFTSPAVIEPVVHRHGLIYDISEFSRIVSLLHRAGTAPQEHAFRMMFRFQRRINRLAGSYRLQLEKYLGDGAFYTSRQPQATLLCAIHLQRLYRRALDEGLPFDRGMRIGLNFGRYRLFPIQTSDAGDADRYEFFGHGVVELSRLTSGKASQEIEEIKNLLISHGYPRQTVLRFFEPLAERNLDVVEKDQESRTFFAYINRNGTLVNEGIVATEEYVAELDRTFAATPLFNARAGGRCYVAVSLDDAGSRALVGIRRLGVAHLKGLEELPVYEVIDGAELDEDALEEVAEGTLRSALERAAAAELVRGTVST